MGVSKSLKGTITVYKGCDGNSGGVNCIGHYADCAFDDQFDISSDSLDMNYNNGECISSGCK
jgi:hypothetical protein